MATRLPLVKVVNAVQCMHISHVNYKSLNINSSVYKKLSYRRGTMQQAMLVNSYYVSRGMRVRKVSNSKSDLQGHSRAL